MNNSVPYKLFIDDERFPIDAEWVIVRSSQEAIDYVSQHGMPIEISFDHDLGSDDKVMTFVHWLKEQMINGVYTFPEGFTYYVHSQNPVGKGNIEGLMTNLLRVFG